MTRITLFSLVIVLVVLLVEWTPVSACPTNCACRGRAAKCANPGLTSLPSGLDNTLVFLTISGSVDTHNTFTSIPANYFQSSPNLFSLTVSFSDVQTVAGGAFSGLNILRDLSLAHNSITDLNAAVFQGVPKLRTLDISGNVNCQFDGTTFANINYLEELNIGRMGIKKLKKNMFSSLTNLKTLKLYGNDIKRIRPEVLLPLSNLESLDVTGNKLLGLEVELKPLISQLKTAHLADNPWQCNCQLLWLKDLKPAFTSSGVDTTEVVCNGPAKLRYASLKSASESDFLCIPPKVVRCERTTYSVNLQDYLQISCKFEGDPVPDVEWLRPDGHKFNDTDLNYRQYNLLENGTLQINGISNSDDGAWRVRAYNGSASDEMTVRVHVIVTTTTLSTTSTTTTKTTPTSTTTRTTTPPTSVTSTTVPRTTSRLMTSIKPNQSPGQHVTTRNPGIQSPANTDRPSPTLDNGTHAGKGDGGKVDIKPNGLNYGLLAGAAVAGGTLVGCICLITMCCQKKKGQNEINPFDDAFG